MSEANPFAAAEDVHVWSMHLDWADDHLRRAEEWLSPDERRRAERFQFDRDRNRFVARRAMLRTILGEYLGVGPGDVAFAYGANGKPALAPGLDLDGLCFNASHSEHFAVIAVAPHRIVGVDVEMIKPIVDFEDIARRFFSERETIALHRVAPADRLEAFFNCWTRKEAFVKASGEGLSRALDSFEVSLAPDEPARLLAWTEADRQPEWSLCGFTPVPGFIAAVAAPGSDLTLRCRTMGAG